MQMNLGSFVTQVGAAWVLLALNKRFLGKDRTAPASTRVFFVLLIAAVFAWDALYFLRPDNYYTFFGISRNYTPENLKRQKLVLSRQFHPDKSDTDGSEFTKVQELHEIFASPKAAGLRKIYDLYKSDLLALYFDKLSNTQIDAYQLEKSHDTIVGNYMIIFIMLFALKELGIHNKRVKLAAILFIVVALVPELAFYEVTDLFGPASNYRTIVDGLPLLNSFRIVEVLELFKRVCIAAYVVFLALYFNFIKKSKKPGVFSLLKRVQEVKKEDSEGVKELAEKLSNKTRKLQARRRSQNVTRAILFIIIVLYWATTQFQLL